MFYRIARYAKLMSYDEDWRNSMQELEILVKHNVSPDPVKCSYNGYFWGEDVCIYHTRRNCTHGRKAPTEYGKPKCKLFDTWLDEAYKKCQECIRACEEASKCRD